MVSCCEEVLSPLIFDFNAPNAVLRVGLRSCGSVLPVSKADFTDLP